ncbi:hypothetical protein BH23PLA1_BH23PLA1_17420 [soil metagenome]
MARSLVAVLILGALVASLPTGCSRPPQVPREHRELILRLATATSAQNPEWLEGAAEEVEDLRAAGELSEAEDRAFTSIIETARAGDWERARRASYSLRDAQRPTEEDVAIAKKRTLPKPKTLDPPRS